MLFTKECKKILHSVVFWIYCVIVVLMAVSEYFSDSNEMITSGPSEGYVIVEDAEQIMHEGTANLVSEFLANWYVCYPYGFIKTVSLKNKDEQKMEQLITEITGADHDELMRMKDEAEEYYAGNFVQHVEYYLDDVNVSENMTYERFKEIMDEVDHILGGGSYYKVDALAYNYSRKPMTQADIDREYDMFKNDDRITMALARYFSDYMGIVLSYLPVFAAAVFTAADRKHRMNELIFTRKTSSFRIVFTRYAALVLMMFIPVFILMTAADIQAINIYGCESVNMTAFFTLPTFWLLPNIMTATAVGMLITEIFSAGPAIVLQSAWSWMSLMSGSEELKGDIGKFTLICRHNSAMGRADFMRNWDNFVFNRIFYMIFSIIMVIIAVMFYEAKRGGRFNEIRLFGKGGLLRRKA